MFIRESEWIISVLERHIKGRTAIDVGSGGQHYLQKPQNRRVHDFLRESGMLVSTLEMGTHSGATYVCDIARELPFDNVPQFDLVLCTNVLEHVTNIPLARDNIKKFLKPKEGYLLVTVPRRFPYHPNPIDNMYRPTHNELAGSFGLETVYSETFDAGRDKMLHYIVCPFGQPQVSGVLLRASSH